MSKTPVKQLQEKLRQLGRQDSSPIEEVGVFKVGKKRANTPKDTLATDFRSVESTADEQGKATCR